MAPQGCHGGLPVQGHGGGLPPPALSIPSSVGARAPRGSGSPGGGFCVTLLGAGTVDASTPVSSPPSRLPLLGLRRG